MLKHVWEQFPQACGGGSRRSEVVVPVENRYDAISTFFWQTCNIQHVIVSGSSWEQAWHKFYTFFWHTVTEVNKSRLLRAGTKRAMSRNWTPSPTSASKKSKGSMASSPSLKRWFFLNIMLTNYLYKMSRSFSPLCGSSWAIKRPGWSFSSTPSYSTASSLPFFTNSS